MLISTYQSDDLFLFFYISAVQKINVYRAYLHSKSNLTDAVTYIT